MHADSDSSFVFDTQTQLNPFPSSSWTSLEPPHLHQHWTLAMTLPDGTLFLGLDCSTQSMSAVVTDVHGAVVHECTIGFDDSFPAYQTKNGVVRHKDDRNLDVVEIPSLLFVDAIDAIFAQLAASGAVDLARVASVSGSAQQHASVYWSNGFSFREHLDTADPNVPLVDVLKSGHTPPFYHENGPSWMDNSTTAYCKALEDAVGGPQTLARISGSRAYERFTGNQIAKRCHYTPSFLDKVGRIALVSSMLTSLLCGDYTPIDESDGSGMNLLDIRKREWADELLNAVAKQADPHLPETTERLRLVLGREVAKPYHTIGELHPYFQQKFGFSPHCVVVPFSGDNPCTLAGVGLSQPGDVAISLGTSSTLMSVVSPSSGHRSNVDGHLFCNPIDPETVMVRACVWVRDLFSVNCCACVSPSSSRVLVCQQCVRQWPVSRTDRSHARFVTGELESLS